MEQVAFSPMEIGKGISDFGFMIMCCASYLINSGILLFVFIKCFIRLADNVIERQQRMLDELLRLQMLHMGKVDNEHKPVA